MEGEPLGGRWWVLRIKKGGGRLDRYLDCVLRWSSCLHVLHRLYAVSIHVSSLLWVDAAGGVPPMGGDGGGWSGGCREPTNFAFDNSAYRWSNGSDIWLLLSISTTGIIGRKKKQRSRPISRCGPLILRYIAFMLCAPRNLKHTSGSSISVRLSLYYAVFALYRDNSASFLFFIYFILLV